MTATFQHFFYHFLSYRPKSMHKKPYCQIAETNRRIRKFQKLCICFALFIVMQNIRKEAILQGWHPRTAVSLIAPKKIVISQRAI